MKINIVTRSVIIDFVCLLFIMLFVYAAVSKLLDFDTFVIQLGQSPLLSAFAYPVAIGVPLAELVISFLLLFNKTRLKGLIAACSLMVMFTTYIVIILNYSAFVPCSCGGIISKMNWNQHLVFNISFVFLSIVGIFLSRCRRQDGAHKKSQSLQGTMGGIIIGGMLVLSAAAVVFLYLISEHEIHRNNGFVRRYPHHPATTVRGIPLQYNSYYIAGFSGSQIYLGNVTAPLHLLSIDTSLKASRPIRLSLMGTHNYPFASVHVRIEPPYFYLADGTVPIAFKGSLQDKTALPLAAGKTYFSNFESISPNRFIFRSLSAANEQVLGMMATGNKTKTILAPDILQKKVDGFFDTDGMLLYNKELSKIIYVYYYRNSFVTADNELNHVRRQKTIDTLSQAPIKPVFLYGKTEKKLATQPTVIQQYATTSGRYLFVKSNRLGRYEPEILLHQASIIDVYDLTKHTYEFSFYLYDYEQEKVKSFRVFLWVSGSLALF